VCGNDGFRLTIERMQRVARGAWQKEFLELLDDHGATLMAMLRRLCANPHDAEDAFQETAVRVWRGFAARPRLRNPRAWVMKIGYRAFLDTRKRRRHGELQESVDDRTPSPVDAAGRAEDCDRVQAAISGLPEPIRDVVVLHYVGGLTLRQTAAAMEVSEGTVKSRLNAALGRLRSALE
jgi:RNA polymerase sigma-70 factor (ECF subfamily)